MKQNDTNELRINKAGSSKNVRRTNHYACACTLDESLNSKIQITNLRW